MSKPAGCKIYFIVIEMKWDLGYKESYLPEGSSRARDRRKEVGLLKELM